MLSASGGLAVLRQLACALVGPVALFRRSYCWLGGIGWDSGKSTGRSTAGGRGGELPELVRPAGALAGLQQCIAW